MQDGPHFLWSGSAGFRKDLLLYGPRLARTGQQHVDVAIGRHTTNQWAKGLDMLEWLNGSRSRVASNDTRSKVVSVSPSTS